MFADFTGRREVERLAITLETPGLYPVFHMPRPIGMHLAFTVVRSGAITEEYRP